MHKCKGKYIAVKAKGCYYAWGVRGSFICTFLEHLKDCKRQLLLCCQHFNMISSYVCFIFYCQNGKRPEESARTYYFCSSQHDPLHTGMCNYKELQIAKRSKDLLCQKSIFLEQIDARGSQAICMKTNYFCNYLWCQESHRNYTVRL